MSQQQLSLTTSLQSAAILGPTRNYCLGGASSSVIISIEGAKSSDGPTFEIVSLQGPSGRAININDFAPFLRYVVKEGNFGDASVWVDADQGIPS